ncbi:polyprenyl synthetase family protein [Amphritea japonica]|uniref:Geranylgeranyl diphosphate synthase, type II n=1 Tax=Amphritea japonica ATCC BAA-1530 TaxID=1278309 RepID=A0A7R6PEI3_9GAMM|nr:farnesyl diphosphate synthase [Amphritea japonica]BBB24927.1 geranylgeranyl diphosphate synthase, type II [Amphritea japonica ATCC BAA-1530]
MEGKLLLQQYQKRVEQQLETVLQKTCDAERVRLAMNYSLFNGGKRVRPVLVYMANQLLNGQLAQADSAACAIECIHSYSLVHDDLPAMDDDELRRGKPTCHIAFDEATAILAGDGLQPLAFELLATDNGLSAEIRLQMVSVIARDSGYLGMVGGQSIDLSNEGQQISTEQLELMHRHKTGALICASIEMGALSSNHASKADLHALKSYANAIGLAFQVKDDILDIEGSTETLGKPQGSDLQHEKSTYPALLGMEGAKQKLALLNEQAHASIADFGDAAQPLHWLADYIVERQY